MFSLLRHKLGGEGEVEEEERRIRNGEMEEEKSGRELEDHRGEVDGGKCGGVERMWRRRNGKRREVEERPRIKKMEKWGGEVDK